MNNRGTNYIPVVHTQQKSAEESGKRIGRRRGRGRALHN